MAVAAVLVTSCQVDPAASELPAEVLSTVDEPGRVPLPTATPSLAPTPAAAAVRPGILVEAGERAAAGMTLGLAVLDVSTGEVAEGRDGSRRFIAASISKLLLVVDLLERRRSSGLTISDADLDLVRRALSTSDDGAMSALWGRYDGPGAIGRVAANLGLLTTRPPQDSSQWGDTQVTAADLTRVWQHVMVEIPPEDRAVIVDALVAASGTAADGFDQFFGLLGQGASANVYAKQAWVPYRPAGYLLHSVGIVHDIRTGHNYAIAMLSIQSHIDAQSARTRLSAVATAMLDALN
jgi:hypothetical protein